MKKSTERRLTRGNFVNGICRFQTRRKPKLQADGQQMSCSNVKRFFGPTINPFVFKLYTQV